MALSVEKLLTDAHTLIIHLRDHDSLADNITASTQALYNKVEAMKQYQDDITELNEIAKHRPRSTLVLGIAQENRQIRELQQENRELEASLEEHQSALELIMQKYREHTVKLLQSNRMEKALQEKEAADKDSMCQLMDKIDEMAGVMQKAIEVDETSGCVDKEKLSRLEVENKALREMLEICTTSNERILGPLLPIKIPGADDEDDDGDTTDTECDSTIMVSPTSTEMESPTTPRTEAESPSRVEAESTSKTEADSTGKVKASSPRKTAVGEAEKDEKEKEKAEDKKKKQPELAAGKETGTHGSGSPSKPVAGSKSATDIRRGKATATSKSTSETGATRKVGSATTVKRDFLKKSPSAEVKRDVKGKPGAKTVTKK